MIIIIFISSIFFREQWNEYMPCAWLRFLWMPSTWPCFNVSSLHGLEKTGMSSKLNMLLYASYSLVYGPAISPVPWQSGFGLDFPSNNIFERQIAFLFQHSCTCFSTDGQRCNLMNNFVGLNLDRLGWATRVIK